MSALNDLLNEEEEALPSFQPDIDPLSEEEKIRVIEYHFSRILKTLGLDLNNDSLEKTPYRYAKMLVKELFEGLNSEKFPEAAFQENRFGFHEMLLESNIEIHSICEHHFMPILGECHVAYIPAEKIIGLSKLNRIARHVARRPQVQERMTVEILETLKQVLETEDVAVVVDAAHLCVRMRGIQDSSSLTRTQLFSGKFQQDPHRSEFLGALPQRQNI